MLLMCNVDVCWNAHDVRVQNYDIEYMHSYHVQDYDNHVLHEIPNLLYYGLLFTYSRMSCLVSLLLSSPEGTCTRQFSCVPRSVSYFHDTLSQAMIHRTQ